MTAEFTDDTSFELLEAWDRDADAANGATIVFDFSDDATLVYALVRAGAHGFISKATPAMQIVDGISAEAAGNRVMLTQRSQRAVMPAELRWPGRDIRLTEREGELLALLPTGVTNRELGAHLYLSQNTIKTQLRSVFSKLHVRDRAQGRCSGGQPDPRRTAITELHRGRDGKHPDTRRRRTLMTWNTVAARGRGLQTNEGHGFAR